jgi:phospholipid/cholesterol/gamma-HCH transport system permease protein
MAEAQAPRVSSIAGWTGRSLIGTGLYVVDLTVFVLRAFRDWARRGRVFNRATLQNVYGQIIFTGLDALPLVSFLGLAVGLSITSQMLKLAQALGSESDVATLLDKIIGSELSSLLTAIVLIGRSGSAIAVDLGLMNLRGEVEGLELLGINVNEFFVTPRIIGAAISQFVLAVYFAGIALFGGVFINSLVSTGTSLHQLKRMSETVDPTLVGLFVLKNLLFGIIIAGTACYHGFKVRRSPTELPQQTQRAIVTSLVLVFAADGLLAVLS